MEENTKAKQPEVAEKRKSNFKQSAKILGYKAKPIKLSAPGDELVILGKKYTYPAACQADNENQPFVMGEGTDSKEGSKKPTDSLDSINDLLEADLLLVARFTYRHWTTPIEGTQLLSDAGWGCMIRVGQMAMYNALVREQISLGEDFLEDRLNYLFIQFNDNLKGEVAPFSIQNIVPLAHKRFNVGMGEWFRSTTIMMTLDLLNQQYQPTHTKDIEMLTLVDSCLMLDKIYERVFSQSASSLTGQEIIEHLCTKSWEEKKLLMTLTSMLGADEPQPEFKPCLDFLMSLPQFVGALGGEGNKAYYIFGLDAQRKTYFYLDPHVLQETVSLSPHTIVSYFKKDIFEVTYPNMNTSLSLCFYIKNEKDFCKFFTAFREDLAKRSHDDSSFISIIEKDIPLSDDDVVVFM